MAGLATAELSKFLNRPACLVHNFNKGGAADPNKLTCVETKRVSHSSYAKQGMRRLLAGGFVCVTTLMLIVYQVYIQPQRIYLQPDLAKFNTTPIILVWTSFFSDKQWLPKTLEELGCKVSQCKITYDRASVWSSSAVVFHWRDLNLDDLPTSRPYGQMWALFNKESPPHTPRKYLDALSTQFNWTITYRRDSDFWAPYGRVVKRGSGATKTVTKKHLVSWLVSNCHTEGHREDYVQELSRYIPVDIYGKCGRTYCTQVSAAKCYQKLGRRYKFYLSLENSICRDYVTEKAYYPLVSGMIPVVFGGGEYNDILPPNSYVDALNFTSPKELAEFLLKIANDSTRYQSYFEWMKYYTVETKSYNWLCQMCERLHQDNIETPSRDLQEWWYGKSECKTWKEGNIVPI